MLTDRGSASGTKVNMQPVGGDDRGGQMEIKDGDEIVVGTKASPYRYRFIVLGERS